MRKEYGLTEKDFQERLKDFHIRITMYYACVMNCVDEFFDLPSNIEIGIHDDIHKSSSEDQHLSLDLEKMSVLIGGISSKGQKKKDQVTHVDCTADKEDKLVGDKWKQAENKRKSPPGSILLPLNKERKIYFSEDNKKKYVTVKRNQMLVFPGNAPHGGATKDYIDSKDKNIDIINPAIHINIKSTHHEPKSKEDLGLCLNDIGCLSPEMLPGLPDTTQVECLTEMSNKLVSATRYIINAGKSNEMVKSHIQTTIDELQKLIVKDDVTDNKTTKSKKRRKS